MHELPVTQSILKIALEHAEKAKAGRVVGLNLVIGELATMVDDGVLTASTFGDIVRYDPTGQAC